MTCQSTVKRINTDKSANLRSKTTHCISTEAELIMLVTTHAPGVLLSAAEVSRDGFPGGHRQAVTGSAGLCCRQKVVGASDPQRL